jgi:membrane dipeptidase
MRKAILCFGLLFLALPFVWPQSQTLHRDAFVMDGHVHVMSRQLHQGLDIGKRYDDGHVDLPRAREGGLDAMFFSVYTPEPYYAGHHEVNHTIRVTELALEQIAKNSAVMELALHAGDIERISSRGKIAAFLDLEGGFDLEGDPLVLRALYRMGMRSIQLVAHNYTNGFADSCCDTRKWAGLTAHGRELIAEMNRLGMVINVAHASEETILQAVEASRAPVAFTHGGFRHFVDIPRSLSDRAAKAIAAKGGVIGIQFGSTFNSPEYYNYAYKKPPVANVSAEVARFAGMSLREIDAHETKSLPFVFKGTIPEQYQMGTDQLAKVIDYGVKLVGEDHIALGSDFDGGPPLPKEIKSIADYPEITKALVRLGYSETRIRKIVGLNWLRLIREVVGK